MEYSCFAGTAAPANMLLAKTFPAQESVGDADGVVLRLKMVTSLLPGESPQSLYTLSGPSQVSFLLVKSVVTGSEDKESEVL